MRCLLLFFCLFCHFHIFAQANQAPGTITIWELSDPDKLNPLTSTSAVARYIQNNIFSRLLEYQFDGKNYTLKPQLATKRPEVKLLSEGAYKGGMSLTYEINPQAKWDDGQPLTAKDYVFTIKALKNPLVNAGPVRPYYSFIDHIEIDSNNSRKFTIYSKETYFLAEAASGDLHILPAHIYDEEGLMQNYNVQKLSNTTEEELKADTVLQQFADQFNSPKFSREVVLGSNAYQFDKWVSGQEILLKRKKDWWGDANVNYADSSFSPPNYLRYLIVRDQYTALTLAKEGRIDVMRGIKPSHFIDCQNSKKYTDQFNFHSPPQFAYYYLGFNMKNPKLSDKKTRQAIAHLVNREDIIELLFYSMAKKVEGPIHYKKDWYNSELEERDFNIGKTKNLLKEAGWKDRDGDGILDKKIDGEWVSLELEYKYNQGNDIRKNIGMLLQENAKKVGIQIHLTTREWTVFLDDTKKRDFEIMCLAWIQGPTLDDMKQIWHSDSDTRDGSNRVGFNNKEADELIDQIRTTLDPEKRKKMYHRVQEIIQEEQPYVFLACPFERIMISKKIENPETSALRPGYQEMYFKLPKRN